VIKRCFGGNGKWLFGGADFNSLEDMISALTTRDPNKVKVYTDHYDGHCLRAYSYFKDQMPDITNDVASINSIKKKYPNLRQDSKTPTFALTYQGTHHTLMRNLGLDKATAVKIETNYHELYKVSDEWVADKLQEACKNGYVTGAFGLRLRTPLLKKNGRGKLHYQAAAEGRTAGNMLGQSYGMLNSRAANEFREKIWDSPYKYDVLMVGQIHDSIYVMWRNTLGITKWVNDNIIDCMKWDGLVELQHPTVKVGAELDIFYPNWANATTLKNAMTSNDIYALCKPETI
jgi:DNA polymerase-1